MQTRTSRVSAQNSVSARGTRFHFGGKRFNSGSTCLCLGVVLQIPLVLEVRVHSGGKHFHTGGTQLHLDLALEVPFRAGGMCFHSGCKRFNSGNKHLHLDLVLKLLLELEVRGFILEGSTLTAEVRVYI